MMITINIVIALVGAVGLIAIFWQNRRARQQDAQTVLKERDITIIPPLYMWQTLPKVSFLVAAWNEAEQIGGHIHHFCQLRYPNKELVLCAGGEDGTYDIARQHRGNEVKVLTQKIGEGKQKALHRALAETTGSIIYLTDADCFVKDDVVEKLIYPIAMEVEQACTGGSMPMENMMAHPIVFSQASTQLYSTLQAPAYASGLLGRNCAVSRELLLCSNGLAAPAPTGTDYVLAKELELAGAQILQLPEVQVQTDYPTDADSYIRQQRRWIRNVFLYGRKYHATAEMNASFRTSLIGVLMLLLPVTFLIIGPPVVLIWSLLFLHALLSRFRYLKVASMFWKRPLRFKDYLWQGPLLLLDFIAWVEPLADYFMPSRQAEW